MFNYENPISEEWDKRYAEQPEEIKKELDDLLSSSGHDFDKWQLRVIKRTRKFPEKGDVFVFSPRDNIYFYGLVINDNVSNIEGDGYYVIALFNNKTKTLEKINFIPNVDNLICAPSIVSRLYWTKGFFYKVDHIENLSLDIDYGFYSLRLSAYIDEYENILKNVPKFVSSFGICTDMGVAHDVNAELIMNNDLLKFDA